MNILLIAPYLDLVKTASETLADSPYNIRVVHGDLETGLRVAHGEIMRNNIDIVVSRGGTASLLRQNLSVPVFEIDVTSFDLLRALYPYAGRGQNIAVVGYENVVSGARSIAEILGVQFGYFNLTAQEKLFDVFERIRKWGADLVVGDTISVNTARDMQLDGELVRSGPEAVSSAVEAAVQFYQHMNEEIIKNKRLNSIMEHSDKGMIYLNNENSVELINTRAEKILGISRYRVLGSRIDSGELPEFLHRVVGSRKNSEIINIDETDYIVEVFPITADHAHTATLVYIQSTGYIQNLEGLIRRQLTSRGLVTRYSFDNIVARNPGFKKTIEKARRYSQADSTILLLGETGAGKEIFAQSIHNASTRRSGPFVAVNCAALPDTLLESELFGYAEGAFTGARKGGKPGLFEMAHEGTIFLDEVNDMSMNVQARLLRVLQEKQVMRIGDDRIFSIDVRVIAATNKDLYSEAEEGRFRRDLYYRLKILDIEIPPLRDRPEDIVPLFSLFLREFQEKYSAPETVLPERLVEAVLRSSWPGNVRQLRNFAEKVSILLSVSRDDRNEIMEDLIEEVKLSRFSDDKPDAASGRTLKEIEAEIILKEFERNNGNVSLTARQLGIDRATLRKKLKIQG